MFKLILKALLVLGLGLVALAGAGLFAVPPAVKVAVERGSSHAFGVPTRLGAVQASPGLGTTTVGFQDYEVSSPEGFEEPLLTFGRFEAGVGTRSLVGPVKELGVLRIEDLRLTILQDGLRSNLAPILSRARSSVGGGPADAGAEPADSDDPGADRSGADDASPGPRLRLGRIRISGIAARLKVSGIPGLEPVDETVTLPTFDEDWSERCGDEGVTVAELSALLLEDLERRALVALDGEVPAEVVEAVRTGLEAGLEGLLEDATNGLEDLIEESAGGLLEGVLGGR